VQQHIEIKTTVGVLASLTDAQLTSLRDNILAEGRWDTADAIKLFGGGDHLGVQPEKDGHPMLYIGIERDGYTHS
jgi:hypothetical protein